MYLEGASLNFGTYFITGCEPEMCHLRFRRFQQFRFLYVNNRTEYITVISLLRVRCSGLHTGIHRSKTIGSDV